MPSLQAPQTPRLESRTPSDKSRRLQVAADDEPIAAAGRHEPPGCRTQLQTAPAASPRWTATRLCRSASPSSLSRSAGLRKMSSVLLPNRSILEASKVSGCDGGLHSRPELSALVTRVGGELAQVMRRRRARTCSMRSAGRRLVPSDGVGKIPTARALAFHEVGPPVWHGHAYGGRPCHSVGRCLPTYSRSHTQQSSARAVRGPPRRMLGSRAVLFSYNPTRQRFGWGCAAAHALRRAGWGALAHA